MALQKDPEGTETSFLHRSTEFAGQRVLEIGCGDGRLTWRYANTAGSLIGIDLDAEALTAAASNCPADLVETVSFVRAGSLDLPFPRETFDIAFLAWSL